MRYGPVILATGIAALSMYRRVYRRMLTSFRKMKKDTAFSLGGVRPYMAYAIIDYSITKAPFSETVNFSRVVTLYCGNKCSPEQINSIRASVRAHFESGKDPIECTVQGYLVKVTGMRVTQSPLDAVQFYDLHIRVGNTFVKPCELMSETKQARDILLEKPRLIITAALTEVLAVRKALFRNTAGDVND